MNLVKISKRSQKILYDSIYMKYPEYASPQRQKTVWWLPGAKGREKWAVTASRVCMGFLWGLIKMF